MESLPSPWFCSLSFQCMHVVHFAFTVSILWELGLIFGVDALQIHSLNILWRVFILYVIYFFFLVFFLWPVQAFSGTPRVQTADWMKKTWGKKLPLFRFLSEDIRILNFFLSLGLSLSFKFHFTLIDQGLVKPLCRN